MNEKTLKQIKSALILILTIAVLAVCKLTASFSICVVLSVFIFIFFWPFAASLEKHKIPKTLVSFICIILMIAIVVGFVWLFAALTNNLIVSLPKYATKISTLDNQLVGLLSRWIDIPDINSVLALFDVDWMNYLMKTLSSLSTSIIGISKNLFLTLLMSAFLLIERNTLIPKVTMASKEESRDHVGEVFGKISKQVSTYLLEKLIISAVTGFLFYLVAHFTGLDFAVLWGVLATIMNFIPTIGSIIVTVITIFMALVQFLPDWTPVLIVACSTTAIQFTLGNVLEPRIQGSTLDLSPFVILVSLSIFNYIWGIIGMFLAVPLLSILEIAFSNMEGTQGIALILSSRFSFKKRVKKEKQKPHQQLLF